MPTPWRRRKMSSNRILLTPTERVAIHDTVLTHELLGEQYADREHQHETASLGMWVFLATEVMFFGVLFLGVAVYHMVYPEPFEKASERLNWQIGGINTIVLLVSS